MLAPRRDRRTGRRSVPARGGTFGLPANSDVAVQQRSAVYVQSNLRTLATDVDASSTFDRDKWAASLTPMAAISKAR